VAPATKSVPDNVMPIVEPAMPEEGTIEVKVGADMTGVTRTLKATALLVPPLVVTVTLCAPAGTVEPMLKETVREVALRTCAEPIEIPALKMGVASLTCTVVAPAMKFVPVSVTETIDPALPVEGAIAVNVGAGIVAIGDAGIVAKTVPVKRKPMTLNSDESIDSTVTRKS
jgi:hypothetical protein